MVTIPREVLRLIQAHGEAAYPHEGAGLLLGHAAHADKTVVAAFPLPNRSEAVEQYYRYLLTPEDMLSGERAAAERGLDVVGIFHSHPDHPALPSAFDRDWALPWYAYVITSVERGRAAGLGAWRLKEDRSAFDPESLRVEGDGGPA